MKRKLIIGLSLVLLCPLYADTTTYNDNEIPTSQKNDIILSQKDLNYINAHKLNKADVKKYSLTQLGLLKYYFYAKEGYTFKSDSSLEKFYKQFNWYVPRETDVRYIYDNIFSPQVKDNIALITEVEKEKIEDDKKKQAEERKLAIIKESQELIVRINSGISAYESYKDDELYAFKKMKQSLDVYYAFPENDNLKVFIEKQKKAQVAYDKRFNFINKVIGLYNDLIRYDTVATVKVVHEKNKIGKIIDAAQQYEQQQAIEWKKIKERACQHSKLKCK